MRRLLSLLGVIALLAAGCGGGSTLTGKQFTAKVKAICADYNARAGHEFGGAQPADPTDPKTTPAEIAQFADLLGRVQTLFHRQLSELAQVDPPPSASDRYATFLDAYRVADSAMARGARAARKGDREGLVAALTRIDRAGAAVDASGIAC